MKTALLKTVTAKRAGTAVLIGAGLLAVCTLAQLAPLPARLNPAPAAPTAPRFLDRYGTPLTATYRNRWNVYDTLPLYRIPPLLRKAVVVSEDKRFFYHGGVDWRARFHALAQDLMAMHIVRGASTITEQAVRILHPRPRTFWSRWLEGWDAMRLEHRFSKAAILEFYLNQVPYGHQRRGVLQAAHYYFDRGLDTLTPREILALAVLVRAPSDLDLSHARHAIDKPIARLAARLHKDGVFTAAEARAASHGAFDLAHPAPLVNAAQFVQYLSRSGRITGDEQGQIYTTLDAELQRRIQGLLDARLAGLRHRNVHNGAVVVIDHRTNEVLAWVNAGGYNRHRPGGLIDAVTVARQPGSALKPFLYAMALERGWTAATLIDDAPLMQPVGTGLHDYHNYSRRYYGPLRLREALANSLNIPAVRTIQFVGRDRFLQRLRALGFTGLTRHPDYYGDGLALGNGAVSLWKLVSAYAVLARSGVKVPVHLLLDPNRPPTEPRRIYAAEDASLIADILSDPDARHLEFGRGALLRFPVQTAVKTGTSTDYRDAWAVGFDYNYTAGVWMGNLDGRPMRGVSGSIGPALVLRAVFAELDRDHPSRPLYLSPKLKEVRICRDTGLAASGGCPSMNEWFRPGFAPHRRPAAASRRYAATQPPAPVRLVEPTPGLELAMDPRIPRVDEMLPLRLDASLATRKVDWIVDGRVIGATGRGVNDYLWPLSRGSHSARARVRVAGRSTVVLTPAVNFTVK